MMQAHHYSLQIGVKVKSVLKERGMHQYELAEELGITETHLSQLLHGRNLFTLVLIAKTESLLQCKLIEVL